jgi:quinoprotein glucose dehydrogenase
VRKEKTIGRLVRTIVAAGAVVAAISLGAQSKRSVLDGVYTEAQAERGRAIYADQCTDCHGRALEGAYESHTRVGDEFTSDWEGQNLLALFDRIRVTMSGAEPGTITGKIPKPLTREQTADVTAFILWFNKIPAGKTELSTKAEVLDTIRFEAPKASMKPEPKK